MVVIAGTNRTPAAGRASQPARENAWRASTLHARKSPGPVNGQPSAAGKCPGERASHSPQNNSAQIDDAVKLIEKKLDDGGMFDDVAHDELREVQSTLAGLSPYQTNAVVSRLFDKTLAKWSGEINSHAPFGMGGASDSEQGALFDDLAADLSGKQLARVAVSYEDRGDIELLGKTIAEHAPDYVKVDFISEMTGPGAASLTDDAGSRVSWGGSTE